MEEVVNTSDPDASRSRKPTERSAQHPAISIEESLLFVADIYRNFRTAFTKRDDILQLIEGSHSRHVAASSYYGFLNREKDSYQVSDAYRVVANPVNEIERQRALLIAFESPTFNKELIEKFDGDQIPKELVAHLSRFHRITEDAAPRAAAVFIENAKYCGVLDESGVLNFKKAVLKLTDPDAFKDSGDGNKPPVIQPKQGEKKEDGEKPPPANNSQLLLDEMVGEEKSKIRLTENKFAYLIYPAKLNKRDIAILMKEIEQLDLIVE